MKKECGRWRKREGERERERGNDIKAKGPDGFLFYFLPPGQPTAEWPHSLSLIISLHIYFSIVDLY